MGIRKVPIIEGEYYHFYNRGNSKQNIFLDDQDYDRFVKLLFLCNSIKNIDFRIDIVEKKIDTWDFDQEVPLISICAWVLMPNHFHLYVKIPEKIPEAPKARLPEDTPRIKKTTNLFMLKIGTAYAKYFNAKYERTGSLFEGKFKSVHVANDIQARYLFSYIHLNPVKLIQPKWKEQGITNKKVAFEYAKNYKYSSFNDWLGSNRKESLILNKKELSDILPENFSPRNDLFEWLSQSGMDELNPPEARLPEDKKGYKLSDFVILYRTHAQSRPIEEEFLTQGFPYKIIGALKFYERKEIKDILAYLRILANPNDFVGLQRIYNIPTRGIGKVALLRLTEFSRKNKLNFLESLLKSREIEELPAKSKFALYAFGKTLEKIKQKSEGLELSKLMKFIADEINYKEYLDTKSEEGYMRWENVKELLTVARKYDSLKTEEAINKFLEEVALIQGTEQIEEDKNVIYMMTLHSAKGLEFPVVFLVGMEEGLLPHSKSLDNPIELEEERRLCYVGITRAKRRVFITLARSRTIFGTTSQGVSSRFLDELPKEVIEPSPNLIIFDNEETINYA